MSPRQADTLYVSSRFTSLSRRPKIMNQVPILTHRGGRLSEPKARVQCRMASAVPSNLDRHCPRRGDVEPPRRRRRKRRPLQALESPGVQYCTFPLATRERSTGGWRDGFRSTLAVPGCVRPGLRSFRREVVSWVQTALDARPRPQSSYSGRFPSSNNCLRQLTPDVYVCVAGPHGSSARQVWKSDLRGREQLRRRDRCVGTYYPRPRACAVQIKRRTSPSSYARRRSAQ